MGIALKHLRRQSVSSRALTIVRLGAAAFAIALVGAGCGTTVDKRELTGQGASTGQATPAPESTVTQPASTDTPATEVAPNAGESQAPAAAPAQKSTALTAPSRSQSAMPKASSVAAQANGRHSAVSSGVGAPSSPQSGGGDRNAPSAPAPSPGVAPTPAPGLGAPKAPILLGSIGTESGVLGEITGTGLQGARAWVADVNARGGLNGHPVKLITADDAGDPRRAASLVRQLVEEQNVMALYATRMPVTYQGIQPYVEQRRIPVIGGIGVDENNGDSPMQFQIFYGGDSEKGSWGMSWAHSLPLYAYAATTKKVSVIYCAEAAICQKTADGIRKAVAPKLGFEIVHEARASFTQPDYTAEVIAARNAGAEALILAMDNAAGVRIAKAAHRQGWRPLLSLQYSSHDERFTKGGGDDVEGALVAGTMPHWDSPSMAEYRSALRHVPGAVKGSMSEATWAGGKLMEVIAKGFPANPTTADFLEGLYALRGETLGGLVPPLTFREGEPHGNVNICIVPHRVEKGRLVPKDGDKRVCPPGWSPVTK